MKKLLLILLIFISISAMSQPTRPPIVTNELQTNILKWNDLLMYRDSLVYFRPVSETSFQVKRPSSSVWSTYDFTEIPDSFFIPDLDIWIVVGQPITQGDSTFYVRQKPSCPNCWQYSYNNTSWLNWFCSETGASNLSIDYNADDILGIHYNHGFGAYRDSLYFRAVEADSGRVPMIVGDSVLWRDIPRDSLFDAYSSDWLNCGDTIPKQNDSIQINGVWIGLGGTVAVDSSNTNELDTIIINGQKLGNLDSIEVDPSVTNELDSIRINGVWAKNGTILILDPSTTNELDTIIINGVKFGHLDSVVVDPSSTNELDTLIINGVKYGHLDSVLVDTSLWDYIVPGLGSPYLKSSKNINVGADFPAVSPITAAYDNDIYPVILAKQDGAGAIIMLSNDTGTVFEVKSTGEMISNNISYPTTDGDSMQVIVTDGNGQLSFVNISEVDSSLWVVDQYGIKSKSDHVGVGTESLSDAAIIGASTANLGSGVVGSSSGFNSAGVLAQNTGTGNYGAGLIANSVNNYSIIAFSDDGLLSNRITVGSVAGENYTFPLLDGDSSSVQITDGHGNLSWKKYTFTDPPTYSGDTTLIMATNGDGSTFWTSYATGQSGGSDTSAYYDEINIIDIISPLQTYYYTLNGQTLNQFGNGRAINYDGLSFKTVRLRDYSWTLDSAKVWVQTNYGKWTPDTYGMNSDSLNVGIGETSKAATKLNVKATIGENSAEFSGGEGVKIDKLTVGSGATITRSGTMASFDFWTGTQAEWTANTAKNGIYPQATTTFWTIID